MTLLAPPPTGAETALALPVCAAADLQIGRGVCALVGDRAVALFQLDPSLVGPGDHGIRAIDNVDPYAGASVLARGLIGTASVDGDIRHYVASPLRKQRFDLDTGAELGGPAQVAVHRVEVRDGLVVVHTETSYESNGPETAS